VKISNEFKIGLMAIIVIAVSVWGYQFLRGRNIIKASNNYYVRYENISQLAATSPVLIHGLKVGTVSSLQLDKDMKSIIATLTLDGGLRIPASTEALIISTGLMGGKAIELVFDKACDGSDCAKPGSYLAGGQKGFFDSFLEKGEEGSVEKVKDAIGEILRSAGDSLTSPHAQNEIARTYTDFSTLMDNLASITTTLNRSMNTYDRSLRSTLDNVATLTDALAKQQDKIAMSISHLESITRQLDSAQIGTNAGALITDAQTTVQSLNSTLTEAQQSFEQLSAITKDLQSGKGSLGKMIKDPALYDNLTRTSKNLDLLLQDFRLNPKRYVNVSVFGKKQKQYNVPEEDPAFRE
jgi:phospholipid/cholesterol/gamma-HCH transport system substrate-binding protein